LRVAIARGKPLSALSLSKEREREREGLSLERERVSLSRERGVSPPSQREGGSLEREREWGRVIRPTFQQILELLLGVKDAYV